MLSRQWRGVANSSEAMMVTYDRVVDHYEVVEMSRQLALAGDAFKAMFVPPSCSQAIHATRDGLRLVASPDQFCALNDNPGTRLNPCDI